MICARCGGGRGKRKKKKKGSTPEVVRSTSLLPFLKKGKRDPPRLTGKRGKKKKENR